MLRALQNVVTGFLRRTWLVALATVLVCTGFAARALAALQEAPGVAAAVPGPALPAPATARPAAPAPAVPPSEQPGSGDAFVARNIFCSACAPGKAGPAGDAYEGHPAVLIATSIGTEPRATVRVVPTEVQGSWALGEEIPGVGRIDEIHPTAIEVADAAGHTKRISLLEAAGPDTAMPGPPPPSTSPGGKPSPFEGRITKQGEGTFEVDRALIRELVMNAARPGMGRANAVLVDGKVAGIELHGIGRSSPAYALELRSRDQITEIDGVPLRQVQQLIDLLAKLETVSSVELAGTRGGKPLKRTLNLR